MYKGSDAEPYELAGRNQRYRCRNSQREEYLLDALLP